MKRTLMVGLLLLLLVASMSANLTKPPLTLAEGDDEAVGECAQLTVEPPQSDDCNLEITPHPLPELKHAVEYDEARDEKGHPRSIFLPEHSTDLTYPVGWQKRNW